MLDATSRDQTLVREEENTVGTAAVLITRRNSGVLTTSGLRGISHGHRCTADFRIASTLLAVGSLELLIRSNFRTCVFLLTTSISTHSLPVRLHPRVAGSIESSGEEPLDAPDFVSE